MSRMMFPVLVICIFFMMSCYQPSTLVKAHCNKPGEEYQSNELMRNVQPNGFTQNVGQFKNDDVKFAYTSSEFSMGFVTGGYINEIHRADGSPIVISVQYIHCNNVAPRPYNGRQYKSSYIIGSDPSFWRSNVPTFYQIIYENLYDGIDVLYYLTEEGLKCDYIVEPGANHNAIAYDFYGAEFVELDPDGNLHVRVATKDLIEEAPFTYQEIDREIISIKSSFLVSGSTISFAIGTFDPLHDLIIDPLIYSTYMGGEDFDQGQDIVVDEDNWGRPTTLIYAVQKYYDNTCHSR